jgi:hypothetical protein
MSSWYNRFSFIWKSFVSYGNIKVKYRHLKHNIIFVYKVIKGDVDLIIKECKLTKSFAQNFIN